VAATKDFRFKDETMTRAAREERIAWRLHNLAEWRHSLLNLAHYHAEYPYDAGQEYEFEVLVDFGTSDPDYVWPDVRMREYDEEGYTIPRDHRTSFFLWDMDQTSCDRLGNRVVVKPDIYFDEKVAARLNLFTRQETPKNVTVPDLAVLLPEYELPRGRLRPFNDCVFRLDQGDSAPELVLKYLSTTTDWQLNSKMHLYAAVGVVEYLVYDPGGMRAPGSPTELLVHRLEEREYRAVAPEPNLSEPDLPAIKSEVFGTHIRINRHHGHPEKPIENDPRLQWYDATEERWRDHKTDAYAKSYAQGRSKGQVEGAINFLHQWLEAKLEPKVREHVAEFWRTYGCPEDVTDKLLAVWQTPNQWPFLLLDPATGPNRYQEADPVPTTFHRPNKGLQAIEYLHTMLQVELEAKVREQVAAVWREEGPPKDWYNAIRAVQRTPLNWRALLLEPATRQQGSANHVSDAS